MESREKVTSGLPTNWTEPPDPSIRQYTTTESAESPQRVARSRTIANPDMEFSRTTARLHAVSACPMATPSLAIRLAPNDAAGVIRLLGLSLDDLRNPEFVAAPLNLPVPFYSRGGADGGRHGCGRGQRVPGASSNSTRTTVCVTSISVDRQSLQKMAREKSEPCRTNKHSGFIQSMLPSVLVSTFIMARPIAGFHRPVQLKV